MQHLMWICFISKNVKYGNILSELCLAYKDAKKKYVTNKMKIYVEKVLDEVVYFSTDYGKAKGIWQGNNRPIDKVYYVEMDIDKLCDYDSFVLCDTKEYYIEMVDENIQFTLLLLEYDEDGCATFRFGDAIIEIETNFDERFYAMKNSYLTISVEKLNIYDENL